MLLLLVIGTMQWNVVQFPKKSDKKTAFTELSRCFLGAADKNEHYLGKELMVVF